MGFLGIKGDTWKKVGKIALKAAPIVAAPFTGGLSLLALGATTGAISGAMDGGGWKGALMGAGLGAIPGGGGAGAAAGGVAKAGLKEIAKGVAKGAATNFATGTATGLATGQGLKKSLQGGGTSALTNFGSTGASGGLKGALTSGAKTVGINAGLGLGAKALAGNGNNAAGQNIYQNYLPQQQGSAKSSGTSGGGMDWKSALIQGGLGAAGGAAGGGGWRGAIQGGTGGAANGLTAPGGGGSQGGSAYPNFVSGGAGQGGQDPPGTFRSTTVAPPQSPGNLPQYTGPWGAASTPAAQQEQPSGDRPASWAERWGPLIAQGAGVAAGALVGRQAQKNALKRSPEEQAALKGAQGAANQLGRVGGELTQQGQDYQRKPGQYFETLLNGNRAAMSQAVAGPTAQITGNYRGAERNLQQQGIRGAARDQAAADLNRQRVSQIAGLTTGMQPYAAEQLAKLGQDNISTGVNALGQGGQLHSGLLGQGYTNRVYSRKEGADTASAIGGLARDVGEVAFKKSPGGATTTKPKTTTKKTPGPNDLPINRGTVPMGPGVDIGNSPGTLPVGDYQVPTGPGVSIGTPPPAAMPFNVGQVDFSGRQTTQMPFARSSYGY